MKGILNFARILGCAALAAAAAAAQNASVVYLRSAGGAPWGVISNESDLNDAFGAANWASLRYETVNPATLFSPNTTFIYMEGGDHNATALAGFLNANGAALAAWVNNGGRLIINAAPNQGSSISLGFGVTLNFDPVNYTTAADSAVAANAAHSVFSQPLPSVGTSFSGGNAFSHAYLTGNGISAILLDNQGRIVLGEMRVGNGLAILGGMTVDVFQSPWPQTHNLRVNLICYAASAPLGQ